MQLFQAHLLETLDSSRSEACKAEYSLTEGALSPLQAGPTQISTKEHFMYDSVPLTVAALIAVGIIVIGCFYLLSPERISGTFGLKRPAFDADARAWLRPKGIRDVASGLVVLAMMLTVATRSVGKLYSF